MIFLVISYIIFLIGFSIYSYFALYHLKEFGYEGDASKLMIIIYILISSVIIITSIIFLIRGSIGV